ncbi:PilZ domain-containing protein [Desulfomarina sp.]
MKVENSVHNEDDRRVEDRDGIIFYLRVFDGKSTRIVGHLVNISPRGLLLLCDDPVVAGEDYRLRLCLPPVVADRREVVISATSRWCSREDDSEFYRAGFQIHDPSPEIAKTVDLLVEKCGYKPTD